MKPAWRLVSAMCVFLPTVFVGLVASPVAANADPVNGGQLQNRVPIPGVLSTPQGSVFTFQATAGTHLTVSFSKVVWTNGVCISISDPVGNQVGDPSLQFPGQTSAYADFAAPATGTYSILVQGCNSDGASATFVVVYATDVQRTLTQGLPLSAKVRWPGQNAVFKFSVAATKPVTVSFSKVTWSKGICMLVENKANTDLVNTLIQSTPVFLHVNDGDLRCPPSQADEFFAAQKWSGKQVGYVR